MTDQDNAATQKRIKQQERNYFDNLYNRDGTLKQQAPQSHSGEARS